ncbi:MAG: VWA domain-containing protein [Planctomycetota bacterium]|nr:VWA domain-containing protein [Planctomycetota bacterium]
MSGRVEQLIFLFVVSLPVLTVAGAILHHRWKTQPSARRVREIVVLGTLIACAAFGFAAWYLELFATRASSQSSRVHFQNPQTLLWLLPFYVAILLLQAHSLSGLSKGRLWFAFLFRSAMLILLMLALAGLQMVVERDILSVIYAIDRSKSVPGAEAQRALDWIKSVQNEKRADDKVGLIVFGGKAAAEVWPNTAFQTPALKDLKAEVHPDATNIADALKRAGNSFEEGTGRRLVLFTDGRQTQGEAREEITRLKAQGVDLWVVPLSRSDTAEMLIEEVKVPAELKWERPFDARVRIQSNVTARARVRLFTGDRVGPSAYEQIVDLKPGSQTVQFSGLVLKTGGPHQIEAIVEPLSQRDDTLAENNHMYTFTDVETDSRILVLTSDLAEVKQLREALEGEKVSLDVRSGASLPENPEEYRRYDCIVLANLARAFLSDQQMSVIESCVKDQGAGLVMIGGDQSFGAGQYLGTPVERALPVSMELKNQKIMPSGALGIVLHTCEFGEGNAWGKKISKAAINVLSPQDYAGLLYFGGPWNGSGETWLFRPTLVARKQYMFSLIDGCEPGDMPNLDTIVSMAVQSLAALQRVSLKHVIVITDGDPAPPTPATLAAAKSAKITITVVTIFPHGGADVSTMKDVAKATGGRYYSADDPRKLPQIFIKEAAVVRKNLIYSDEKGIPLSIGSTGELLRDFGQDYPKVKAFVVTAPKDRAEMHLFATVEGEKVPVLSRWHYGLGKSIAFTSDATNRWAPDWVSWPSYKKFWTNAIQWVSRQRMPSNFTVSMPPRKGDTQKILVEGVDAQGNYINFAKLVGSATEPGVGEDLDAVSHRLNFVQTEPGRYEAEVPVNKNGAYTVTITDLTDPSKPNSLVSGFANSYSAEFLHLDVDHKALKDFGDLAGEGRLKDLAKLAKDPRATHPFVHDLPPVANPQDYFWWLLVAAVCLFPFDVAVRRLHIDPLVAWNAVWARLAPMLELIKSKGGAVKDAVAEASAKPAPPPAPSLMPTGSDSREAQSRYEDAGGSEAAAGLDLRPQADPKKPAAVGGAKLTPVDNAASDYTRALLKAKKKAKRDE